MKPAKATRARADKPMVLGKAGVIRSIASRTGLAMEIVSRVLDAFLGKKGVVLRRLKAGHTIVWPGFGKFHFSDKTWRWSRNPATGEDIRLPPRRQPLVKFSDVFRARVSKGVVQVPDPDARPVKPSKAVPKGAAGKVPSKRPPAPALEEELTPDPDTVDDEDDDIDEDDIGEDEDEDEDNEDE